MTKTSKKLLAGLAIAGLAVGGLIGGIGFDDSKDVKVLQNQLAELQNQPAPIADIVEVEVAVDNGNLDLVLNHLYDNDGNVNYLLDDLDDDEVDQIADRITFINEIKSLSVNYLKAEAADALDKEVYTFADNSTVTFDEDDLERIRVQDDADEVVVDSVDFEDSDADVLATVYFEQDDVKFAADFNVEFKDGEVDDLDLLEIRER